MTYITVYVTIAHDDTSNIVAIAQFPPNLLLSRTFLIFLIYWKHFARFLQLLLVSRMRVVIAMIISVSHLHLAGRKTRTSGGDNGQIVRKRVHGAFMASLIRLYNHCESELREADSAGLRVFTSLQFARASLSARVSYISSESNRCLSVMH